MITKNVLVEKIWYLYIEKTEGEWTQEGPYSLDQLARDLRLTPDTFAWKEGMPDWMPIGKIPELKSLFQQKDKENEDSENEEYKGIPPQDEIALDVWKKDPFFFFFWFLIAFLLILYFLWQ